MQQQRILLGRELRYRNGWLIRLRYFAVAGMAVGGAGAWAAGLAAPWGSVAALVAAVLGYNLALHLVYAKALIRDWFETGYWMAVVQVVLDLVSLTALIHWTGGVQTPLVFFYVFHAIIAAILLSRRAAYQAATLGAALLMGLAALEQSALLPPQRVFWSGILGFGAGDGQAGSGPVVMHPLDTVALVAVISATLYLSVYMTFSLSRELRAREERARSANEKLQEQDRLRSEYVRLIAHDLKDPLAGIQSNLRVLLDGYVGELTERQRHLVGRAEERAVQLIQLIHAMLDLSRLRAHTELERSRWSFVEMVRAVAEPFRSMAEAKHVTLTLELPDEELVVHANRNVLEQIFLNLISNAVKYTPAGGDVRVRLRDRGADLEAEVGDSGIGIPKESLTRVFDEFYRAPNAKQLTRDGTGLGLALVREIVNAYGGTIRVESPWRAAPAAEPRGTLITVRLPWTDLTRGLPPAPTDGAESVAAAGNAVRRA